MRGNPFDYTRPLNAGTRLPGRSEQIDLIRGGFASLANRQPNHLCLIGPRRTGKSSLLLTAKSLAREYQALPVLVAITRSVVREVDGLFNTMVEAAVFALERDALDPTTASATRLSGSVQAVDRFEDLVSLAAATGFGGGVAVLLDQMEVIGEEDATYQTLATLAEYVPGCLFICAGEPSFLTAARQAYPKVLQRFHLEPVLHLADPGDVQELLTYSHPPGGRPPFDVPLEDLMIFSTAGGLDPHWITVLAHFAWDEMEPKDPHLHLTARSLKRAIRVLELADAEFVPSLFEEIDSQIKILDDLSRDDLERASFGYQFQQMSIGEAALARVCRDDGFHSDVGERVDAMRQQVEADISRLSDLGLATQTEDVFQLNLNPLAVAYLGARLEAQGGPASRVGVYRYGTYVARAFVKHLAELHTGLVSTTPVADRFGATPSDDPGMPRLAAAAEARDALQIVDALPYARDLSLSPPDRTAAPLAYLAVRFRVFTTQELAVEMDTITTQALFWCKPPDDAVNVEFVRLLDTHADELADLRLQVDSYEVAYLDEPLGESVTTLLAPATMSAISHSYYDAGEVAEGRDYLLRVLPLLEKLQESGSSWWTEGVIDDARNNLGFFSCLAADTGAADRAFAAIAEGSGEPFLVQYNRAFVRALRGQFAAAARMLDELLAGPPTPDRTFVMLMFPPPVEGWHAPSATWRTTWARGADIKTLIRAQRIVYWSHAGAYSDEELDGEISELLPTGHGGTNRLLGWLQLSRGRKRDALALFHASLVDDLAADIARSELAFAEGRPGQH